METKFKIFDFKPENAEEIGKLISSVRVMESGFFIMEGRFGIMYKEKGEYGVDNDSLINTTSGEISKAQKQVLTKQVEVNAFEKLIEFYKNKKENLVKQAEEARIKWEGFVVEIPEELQSKIDELNQKSADLNREFQSLTKKDREKKDKILEQIKAIEDKLAPLRTEKENLTKAGDEQKAKLKDAYNQLNADVVNTSGDIKTHNNYRDEAIKDRAQAIAFVEASAVILKDLMENKTKIVNFLPVFGDASPAKKEE